MSPEEERDRRAPDVVTDDPSGAVTEATTDAGTGAASDARTDGMADVRSDDASSARIGGTSDAAVEPTDGGWVRPAAVAGQFYDADPLRLRAEVELHVARAVTPAELGVPKAVIAPHAGFRYSGPTAGFAYDALAARREVTTRVVLVGPAHRVRLPGIGVSTARAWSTPLGEVILDHDAIRALLDHPSVMEADAAHRSEHSLEVHLPFLLATLGPFALVPLVVGHCSPEEVASVLERVWGGDETLVVASTDLSHYHDDATARALDRRTAEAIVHGDVEAIQPGDACGRVPVAGLLLAAARHRLAVRLLDLSTSADTGGTPERVVGYGSFALVPA